MSKIYIYIYICNHSLLLLGCRTTEHCHNEEDVDACLSTVTRFGCEGLILCGGFATVSTAAILSETFLQRGCRTSVVAIPVSIESGLPSVETVRCQV